MTKKGGVNNKLISDMKKKGRPTKYNKELGEEICARIMSGESLIRICKDDEMPSKKTVISWLASTDKVYAGFLNQYARAREFMADLEFEEIKEITDEEPHFYSDENGNKRVDTGWIQYQRLRADKRQWRTSKLKPKKYGNFAGQEGGLTLNVVSDVDNV